ncbi:hypothetical protein ASG31_04900 [Chryseobacterium sp. Leaf404]|uniref:hypothetical protein n=1 Tax=unclassified Chryseobacterium TaxID=2593645 RepID=UPI0006FF06F9|nr:MULTISPECIES: hypothetical protein [unclassified Chryseobacterium]KQT18076.1 hypothetical protein ASG31_04900 [Chryseobacterium sp. Leaf404]
MKSWLKIAALFLIFILSASFTTVNAQRHHHKKGKHYYKPAKHHHKRVAHYYRKPVRHRYYAPVGYHRPVRRYYRPHHRGVRHYPARQTVVIINR